MTTAKATWSVLVVYDNPETREAAVCFCDQLVQRFWTDFEFDVNWWPAEKLKQSEAAEHAAQKAAKAHLIIFALPEELDPELARWIDGWALRRGDREGAVVGLLSPTHQPDPEAAETHRYLRQIAHRAGMDFLTQVPSSFSWQIPESVEFCNERARRVTSVLDEILHQQSPPRLTR